jgi:hypothetical protein
MIGALITGTRHACVPKRRHLGVQARTRPIDYETHRPISWIDDPFSFRVDPFDPFISKGDSILARPDLPLLRPDGPSCNHHPLVLEKSREGKSLFLLFLTDPVCHFDL